MSDEGTRTSQAEPESETETETEAEALACPIAASLTLVGSRSATLLLREAFAGTSRFEDFTRRVGISPATAAAQLRGLVAAGLLEREAYREPGERTRERYRLTRVGWDYLPVLVALFRWGSQHALPGQHALPELSHAECGAPVGVELRCSAGHRVPADRVLRAAVTR